MSMRIARAAHVQRQESSRELTDILHRIGELMDEGRDLVSGSLFSNQDKSLYCKNIGAASGNEILNILMELYTEHPHLIPPRFLLREKTRTSRQPT